jgi:hypothetical protein
MRVVVALVLAVAASGTKTALAQTVVPTTTVTAQPDSETKAGPKDGKDEPKPEQPKAEAPKAEQPKAEAPKPEQPKADTPKPEQPKADKPVKPADATPKPAKPTLAQSEPKPETPKPAEPNGAQADAPSVQPNGPGTGPTVAVAKAVPPRSKPDPSAATSHAKHVATLRDPVAKQSRSVSRGPVDPAGTERSTTISASSGRDRADATLAASEPAAVTPKPVPRRASYHVAAAAADSIDGQRHGVLILDAPRSGYDVTIVLAIVLAAGVGFLFGRGARRGLRPWPRR